MNREYRFKLGGLFFFILIFGVFLSTTEGCNLIFNSSNYQMGSILIAIFGLLAIYASSEGFGYLFNSIFFVLWSRIKPRYIQGTKARGYSADQEKYFHSEHMRNRIVKSGQEKMMNIPKEIQEYSYETYYYYFFHKYAPNNLKEHIERRWTHFAVGMTEIVAIIFALLFSLYIIIFEKHWELTRITYVIIIFSAFFSIICLYNALLSRRDALEMLDLWMYANFDGEGKCIFSKFEKEMSDKK